MLIERVRDVLENYEEDIKINMELMCGASLAHHGLLGSMRKMVLCNVDMSRVSAQHLASLASCVTIELIIQNVSGCDLVSILSSIKCEELIIRRQSLGREETLALVEAMESRVEDVLLCSEVTLDIEALNEYSGQGVCLGILLYSDTARRYREEIRTFASKRKWKIRFSDLNFTFLRIVNEERYKDDDGHD